MDCAEFESSLADFFDGTLAPEVRLAVEQHAAFCAGCSEFMADARTGLEFLRRDEGVEPPPELITRIAFLAPMGRTRHPLDRPGFFGRMSAKWLQPLVQPRFAMGMAMTIVSFAMLERCTGIRVQHIQAADLSPVRILDGIEDRAMRLKDRAVKNYENIRLVYEVETKLRDFEAQQDAQNEKAPRKQTAAELQSQSGTKGGDSTAPKRGTK